MSMVKPGIIKRSSCKSNAVSRVSDKLVKVRGNRHVSEVAGVNDQGQISKLLARLEGHELLANTGGHTQGIPRAWRLTPHGEEIVRIGLPRSEQRNGYPDLPEVKR
jgi:uncharacterized lipoprotein YajG